MTYWIGICINDIEFDNLVKIAKLHNGEVISKIDFPKIYYIVSISMTNLKAFLENIVKDYSIDAVYRVTELSQNGLVEKKISEIISQ